MENIVILTGAGISAESGLQTFRAEDGLWCEHRVEDVATPEAFARDPALVHRFYNRRRSQLKEVEPNAAHHALAELSDRWEGNVLIITQNVDDLHDRALRAADADVDAHLIHMHGELLKAQCLESGEVIQWEEDLSCELVSPLNGKAGSLRPHIVWFGEMPLQMDRIYSALRQCDVFVSIGTSGNVYPAAGFVAEALNSGAETVELNLEPSSGASMFEKQIYGKASEVVPAFISDLLS